MGPHLFWDVHQSADRWESPYLASLNFRNFSDLVLQKTHQPQTVQPSFAGLRFSDVTVGRFSPLCTKWKGTLDVGYLLKTNWQLDTSEETSGSLLATIAFGKLYFSDTTTGDKMVVKYRSFGVGEGKGLPIGANWSNTSDPSGGFDNVGVVPGHYFGPLSFPCRGYMIGIGASSAVVGSILGMDVTGGGLSMAIFGMIPVFAAIRMWGLGRAALPGAGIGGSLASFELVP